MPFLPKRNALRLSLLLFAVFAGVVMGEALDRMSPVEIEEALQQCGFVQELNQHRKLNSPAPTGRTQQLFATLFPYGPALNSLLATAYISGPPNFLLALCPPNVNPSSLSTMVAFAVGGLLGDTIFHLLPEIFLGETTPDEARFVLIHPNKNLLLGVAIIVGFVTFLAMDKLLRIGTGGHQHRHDSEDEKTNAETGHETTSSAVTTGAQKPSSSKGSVRSRKQVAESAAPSELLDETADLSVRTAGLLEKLRAVKEPSRSDQWLADIFEEDADCGVTQIAIWKAYESAFGAYRDVPLLEATLLIHNAAKMFRYGSAQIIEGDERKFIVRGLRPKLASKAVVASAPSAKSDQTAAATKLQPSTSIKLGAYLNLIADFTHNITDGLAISSSFYASPTLGATTTVAVFFHEIPHEVGDFALLIQSGFSKRKAMGAQFITAVGAFLGTCIGIAVQELGKDNSVPTNLKSGKSAAVVSNGFLDTGLGWGDMLLPFTAGTFLYVGTVAVIPEMLETGPNKQQELKKTAVQFAAMVLGAGIMLAISWT